MWPWDGFAWYWANMETMVLRSGRVPWESHRSEPTIERSSDASCWRSEVERLECGTESTGWPDRYGDAVVLACCILCVENICSANACCDR